MIKAGSDEQGPIERVRTIHALDQKKHLDQSLLL